jgi:hypothetical protein
MWQSSSTSQGTDGRAEVAAGRIDGSTRRRVPAPTAPRPRSTAELTDLGDRILTNGLEHVAQMDFWRSLSHSAEKARAELALLPQICR